MTGIFVRVQRQGKWQPIEIEYLTDCEREKILRDDNDLMQRIHDICHALQVHVLGFEEGDTSCLR